MKYNIPEVVPTTYTVQRDQSIASVYVSQSRDMLKALRSPNYNDNTRTIHIPAGSIIQVIRIADGQARIEITKCLDKNLQRVKFYLAAQDIGLLDLDQNK